MSNLPDEFRDIYNDQIEFLEARISEAGEIAKDAQADADAMLEVARRARGRVFQLTERLKVVLGERRREFGE